MQEMHECRRCMHFLHCILLVLMHLMRIMHFLHCIFLVLMHLMQIMHLRQLSSQCKFAVYFKLSDVHETQENSHAQECKTFRDECMTE